MSVNERNESELTGVEIDDTPTKASTTASLVAAVIGAATSAPFAVLALPLGIGGIGMIAFGLIRKKSRMYVSLGAACLFLSVMVASGFGTPVEFLLLSTIAIVLAWDFGQNAISLGEQMGRQSKTKRNEIIHGAASTIVVFAAAGIGYGMYLGASGGQPVSALATMLLGLVFLIWAIRT